MSGTHPIENSPSAKHMQEHIRENVGEEQADWFTDRYAELIEMGATPTAAHFIASGEILVSEGYDAAEAAGEGFASVDGLEHEIDQWRAEIGAEEPDDIPA
ncbi:NAD-glutamate dehydrogenase [Halogeometricum borinquense]|uniref:NAD-glutamate dehydrogenase n=1 Tax=Halogeometricum borinquense TaxID=60847 RepID=A0A6C0UK98_9EURY|nr:NAD-glutamate dehydrogenase [Halogeometricum borinquense]QIB74751.1 NAD-glutamate dehydrogenase [Halogeometricum borinquense]